MWLEYKIKIASKFEENPLNAFRNSRYIKKGGDFN